MIVDINDGEGLTGAWNYVFGQGNDENGKRKPGLQPGEQSRAEFIGQQNMDGLTPDTMRRVMEFNAQLQFGKRKCEKDAVHISLSLAPGQTLSNEKWSEAGKSLLNRLGMKDAQAVMVRHKDKEDREHVHIVGSNIIPKSSNGTAYDTRNRRYRGWHWSIDFEAGNIEGFDRDIPKSREWCHRRAELTKGEVQKEELVKELMKGEATITRGKLNQALVFGGHIDDLEPIRENFVKDAELIRLKKHPQARVEAYTTKEMWAEENKALWLANEIKNQTGFNIEKKILDRFAKEFTLDKEQKEALLHATRDNGLSLITGEAGTGKTRTLSSIRKATQYSNRSISAHAFTNKVTLDLQNDGFDASTIASLLDRLNKGLDTSWKKGHTAVLEEAAQISTSDKRRLFHHAKENGVKLILAGDPHQLGSIKHGGLFDVMAKRYNTARLTDVKRNPNEKEAWHKMHRRKFEGKDGAVEFFRKIEAIKWNDNEKQSMDALVKQWMKDHQEKPKDKRLILAATNERVDKLNEIVRDIRKNNKELGKEIEIIIKENIKRQFAVNDRIVLTETPDQKLKGKGLANGSFGHILDWKQLKDGTEFTVELDRKKEKEQRRIFKLTMKEGDKSPDEIRITKEGIRLGYASTTYKAQGGTLDQTYIFHDPNSQVTNSYVNMTRHSKQTKLYVSRSMTQDHNHLAVQLSQGHYKTAAHAYIVDERDKEKLNTKPKEKEMSNKNKPSVGQSAYGKELKEGEVKGWPKGISNWADLSEKKQEPKQKESGLTKLIDHASDPRAYSTKKKSENAIDKAWDKADEMFKDGIGKTVNKIIDNIFGNHSDRKDRTAATGFVRKGGEADKGNMKETLGKDTTEATRPGILPGKSRNDDWEHER